MNADLKLPVKYLERGVFGKLIDQSKNGGELSGEIETLNSIQEGSFSDRLHFVARTFYFRLLADPTQVNFKKLKGADAFASSAFALQRSDAYGIAWLSSQSRRLSRTYPSPAPGTSIHHH